MKRQILASVLILMLILSIVGCDMVHKEPTSTENSSVSSPEYTLPTTEMIPNPLLPSNNRPPIILEPEPPVSDEEMDISCQYLPQVVENPEGLPVLKWLCLLNRSSQTWTEDAVHELNQMLADQNMPFRIQFILLTTTQSYLYSDWFSRDSVQNALEEADLIYSWMTPNERKEFLLPITDYVTGDAKPSLKNAVAHELNWLTGLSDDEIYGIPTWLIQPYSAGWQVDSLFLKDYGLSKEDFNCDFWEMDKIFAKLYEENGNKPFLFIENDGYMLPDKTSIELNSIIQGALYDLIAFRYEHIGACFSIDYSTEIPTVVNTLEIETVKNIWEAIMRYQDAGYITNRYESSSVYYGTLYGETAYIDSDDKACIPVTASVFNSYYSSHYISGVSVTSQHTEEAITLLNLIAEDIAFQTQLFFGKQGRDYTLTDGDYTVVRKEDGSNYKMDFLSMHSYFNSVMETENSWMLIAHEGKTKLQTYQDNLDSVSIRYYPIIFDYTGFEQEIDEMEKIFNVYFHFFTNDADVGEPSDPDYIPRMTEELYDQMLQELKDAGSDKIIAELQRQLDEWLAENPDWKE